MRVVLDTNILISGLITPGNRPPGKLLDALRRGEYTLVTSLEQLAELKDVLGRPHLAKYLAPGAAQKFLGSFDSIAEIIEGPLPEVTGSPDPKDNMILATALAGNTRLIVSGDKRDLVALEDFRGVKILTASQAEEYLRENTDG